MSALQRHTQQGRQASPLEEQLEEQLVHQPETPSEEQLEH